MRIYELHFYDQDGRRPALDFSECDDDGAAAREAFRGLREHRSCTGVEVFEGERLVARLERPSDAFLVARSGIHGAG